MHKGFVERKIDVELLTQIQKYIPWNPQEETDRLELMRWLRQGDVYTRDNSVAHLTASAWVVSPDRELVLMAYHKLYSSWAWLGGHADGQRDLLQVAIKEAREESGIGVLRPLQTEPFSLEILTVQGHEKRGQYISSHLHLNVTFLLEAPTEQVLSIQEEENSAVAWLPADRLGEYSSEPWFVERIYGKLTKKCRQLYPAGLAPGRQ